MTYRVAAIQYEPTLGEKERNVCDLLHLTEEAAEQGARLIVLPELATTGACWVSREEIAAYTEPIPGATTERFQQVARRYTCYIAVGMPEVDVETHIFYDALVLLGPDGVIGRYRKLHSSIAEPRWARDGDDGMPVWETPLGRIGAIIGTDVTYFEAARLAALHKADILVYATNWGGEMCPSGWWMARAFENDVYMIAANRCGRERGVQFNGGSCVINPDGTVQEGGVDGEGIVYGEVNLDRCHTGWRLNDVFMGDPLGDRRARDYAPLLQNTYLWEPLRYHGLYELGELPMGQLSCAGVMQMDLSTFTDVAGGSHRERIEALGGWLKQLLRDSGPAVPDVLVLPELFLPGPLPLGEGGVEEIGTYFRGGAIQVPGEETEALVQLANEVQMSIVVGVAERADGEYYNTVLLVDPEGVYGIYRKVHLSQRDQLWASYGNLGLPTFDTPTGRIGLATGYDVLFPETLRVLASKGTDIVCAPAMLAFPDSLHLPVQEASGNASLFYESESMFHFLIWRVRAAEHNVYLAIANWYGDKMGEHANGLSGIFAPNAMSYPWSEVVADEDESGLMMMTIDTREQRTGQRTTRLLEYSPGDMVGSLTGELAYDILDSIPGNVVRSKPLLRKRVPYWYLDLVRPSPGKQDERRDR